MVSDNLPPAGCGEPAPPGLLRGIEQFNQREYFECHETLELIWNAEPGAIRTLYKSSVSQSVVLAARAGAPSLEDAPHVSV
jgi:hypothetical protein